MIIKVRMNKHGITRFKKIPTPCCEIMKEVMMRYPLWFLKDETTECGFILSINGLGITSCFNQRCKEDVVVDMEVEVEQAIDHGRFN